MMMRSVRFEIERETEKALYCCVFHGEAGNTTRYMWIPKSVCRTQEYVATVDYLDNPLTYGRLVIEVAEWFCIKNKIR